MQCRAGHCTCTNKTANDARLRIPRRPLSDRLAATLFMITVASNSGWGGIWAREAQCQARACDRDGRLHRIARRCRPRRQANFVGMEHDAARLCLHFRAPCCRVERKACMLTCRKQLGSRTSQRERHVQDKLSSVRMTKLSCGQPDSPVGRAQRAVIVFTIVPPERLSQPGQATHRNAMRVGWV